MYAWIVKMIFKKLRFLTVLVGRTEGKAIHTKILKNPVDANNIYNKMLVSNSRKQIEPQQLDLTEYYVELIICPCLDYLVASSIQGFWRGGSDG